MLAMLDRNTDDCTFKLPSISPLPRGTVVTIAVMTI